MSALMEKITEAVHSNNFDEFQKIVMPLIDFEDADESTMPKVADPDLAALLEDAEDRHYSLHVLEAPDPYFLCDYVDRHVKPSPVPDFEEWGWVSVGGHRDCRVLARGYDEDLYTERMEIIERLYDEYEEDCREAQRKEWLYEIFWGIVKDHSAE